MTNKELEKSIRDLEACLDKHVKYLSEKSDDGPSEMYTMALLATRDILMIVKGEKTPSEIIDSWNLYNPK